MRAKTILCLSLFVSLSTMGQNKEVKIAEWVSTTYTEPWKIMSIESISKQTSNNIISIDLKKTAQTIDGFGTCFNELGWTSLSLLDDSVKNEILKEMFAPGIGANFTICRMPIAANDFSLDWYSYNETEGDFDMKDFSIQHDYKTLIPFIHAAKYFNPDISIWASPWSPPSWMKYNKHYAGRSTSAMARNLSSLIQAGESTYMANVVDNGLPEELQGVEGTDMFIQEDKYLKAYALYFSKFIEAYQAEGINIFGVMPQNEFNSPQIFPSACWTAKGLANFIGKYLGPMMEAKGVETMFGTMERPHVELIDTILQDPHCERYIKAVGFQWAGKRALPEIHEKYPNIKLYQTEQECGNGKNDWKGAISSWNLMKQYLNNGTSVYTYWNTSLIEGGISRWGWAQNSLVTVNETNRTFNFTPEYYVMKHVSHYVTPKAQRIEFDGNYDDALCFLNPDRSIILVISNKSIENRNITIAYSGKIYTPTLSANSLNTLVLKN